MLKSTFLSIHCDTPGNAKKPRPTSHVEQGFQAYPRRICFGIFQFASSTHYKYECLESTIVCTSLRFANIGVSQYTNTKLKYYANAHFALVQDIKQLSRFECGHNYTRMQVIRLYYWTQYSAYRYAYYWAICFNIYNTLSPQMHDHAFYWDHSRTGIF